MNITLLIIGLVIGGIATLVTVIFTIISLATGKNKNAGAWGAGFVLALTILILSIFSLIRKVGEKVKTGVEWLEEHKNDGLTVDSDNDAYSKQERAYFLDSLIKYTNPAYEGKVPADFYENKTAEKQADGKIIVPFVYPLSIRYSPNEFTGEIFSDINDSVFLKNISTMAFDENFAIAKVDNAGDAQLLKEGRGEIEYILFDLRTREFLQFTSEQQLLEKAGKIGYTGSQTLIYLTDLYRGWIDTLNFDF